ncbi:cadherin-like domain-containing protein [Vibrio sp. HN007]|uniref:cadherin-like domain-containing protein n=1 Tax=Vibrio iocasae TaxID=3098914 RepID=UPI0035D4F04E
MMREITFVIPGYPPITVHATEQTDGSLLFELSAPEGEVADLRGLYFNLADPSLVDNLNVVGSDINNQEYKDVSNFNNGNNMKGGGREPYDVGLDIGTAGKGKDIISDTSFTLSSLDGEPLSLDLISQVEFGIRMSSTGNSGGNRNGGAQKITTVSPAAPNASDDTSYTLEDQTVIIDATANDTDADGDELTIIEVGPALNGTIEIVDNQIHYTANEHWSGTDTFTYKISDGSGGYDVASATVHVEAVADAPDLSLIVRAGDNVNEVVIDIQSALVDTDGSESYVLYFSDLPEGVVLQGVNGNQVLLPSGQESIKLLLSDEMDFDFDFSVSAMSTESSNNDTATTTETVNVVLDYNESSNNVSFNATDQSMWTSGEEFVFTDNRFLGFDIEDSGSTGGLIRTDWSYDLKAGFESDLRFEGGGVSAEIPWQLDFGTSFNRTTDVLTIDTAAMIMPGGFFDTEGPSLEYQLDFIFEYALSAGLRIYKNLPDPFPNINVPLIDASISDDYSVKLIEYDSEESDGLEFEFPYGIYASFDWPNLEVGSSEYMLGTYTGSGASNNFLDIGLDIDQTISDIFLGGFNPFDLEASAGIAGVELELLDVDVFTGLNFLQDFHLDTGILDTRLVFENGTETEFTFGDELSFDFASHLDTDNNGVVEFSVMMDLVDTMFTNETDVGFNVGYNFDLLKGGWWYGIDLGALGSIGDSGSFGPVVDLGGTLPIASLEVYNDTFEVNFEAEQIDLFA